MPSWTSYASACRSRSSRESCAWRSCPGSSPPEPAAGRSLHAQVALQDLGIGPKLAGRPLVRDMAVVEDVGTAREREAGGDVLLDQHDGLALLRQLAAGPHQVLDDHRRQSLEGFVEQDDLRIAHQRPGDGEHLLLAPGEIRSPAGAT